MVNYVVLTDILCIFTDHIWLVVVYIILYTDQQDKVLTFTCFLPKGTTEIYFPRNLLSIVICCHRVHPRCDVTWWAAAGGWWLTWEWMASAGVSRGIILYLYFCSSLWGHFILIQVKLQVSVCVKYTCRDMFVFASPAHRWSDNHTPPVGPARKSPPAEGWRAWLYGGLWWSRRRQKRQPPGTSAPERSHSEPPGPGARCTPDPQSDAAASTAARWSLPAITHRQKRFLVSSAGNSTFTEIQKLHYSQFVLHVFYLQAWVSWTGLCQYSSSWCSTG